MATGMRMAGCVVGGVAAVLGAVGSTHGQVQPCGAAAGITGPDVIVGMLGVDAVGDVPVSEIFNYTAQSLSGVLHDGLSAGTYSCNIGTQPAAWFDGTVNIPVISQSLYRYTRDAQGVERFEMLSYAWLKYGFTALQHAVCCATCTPTGGTQLGVGCSDPYTASRNAAQNGLGPRWQINAATGAHPVDPASPGFSGAAGRRIQVPVTQLPPSDGVSVRYFVEAQHITPDDAAAGNKDNNASHREATVTGTGTVNKTFNWVSPQTNVTVRMRPAMEAWKEINPMVTRSTFIVPGDGKFYVLSNATDLQDGRWHYEYAVFNLNSDRNAGTFTVPIGAGATESDAGFHDFAYHDGDGPGNVNVSGTDWPAVRSGGFLEWATQTQAQNNSANAIRWGSTYNFRFVCDQAPVAGRVRVGLWKPGTPSDFEVAAVVPGTPVCDCDRDENGELDSSDFMLYLDEFFALDRDADFNQDDVVDSSDYFEFLGCFFGGC